MWAGMPGAVVDMSPSSGPVRALWLRGRPRRCRMPHRELQPNIREPGVTSGNPYHLPPPAALRWQETNRRGSVGGERGMPSASFGGGAVRVRTPGSYDATRGPRPRRPRPAATDPAAPQRNRHSSPPWRSRTSTSSTASTSLPDAAGTSSRRVRPTAVARWRRRRRRSRRRRGRASRARRGLLVAPARCAPTGGTRVAGTPHRVLRDHRPAAETRGSGRPGEPPAAGPRCRAAPRPWAARRPRARRGAGDRAALRRAGRRRSRRAQARGARAAGTRPRRRSVGCVVAARSATGATLRAADRPAGARAPPRARHLLVDGAAPSRRWDSCRAPRASSRRCCPPTTPSSATTTGPSASTPDRMPTTCWPSCGATTPAPT